MKKTLLAYAAMALAWGAVRAQPPPGESAPPEQEWAPAQTQRIHPPPVQRYFDLLRERNPAEFDRLHQLREVDPEAFRRELRERLQEARGRAGLSHQQGGERGHPPGPDERETGHPKRGGAPDDPMAVRTPELDRLEARAMGLARDLRTLAGEEREPVARELRTTLAETFDLRESLRRERLARMQERLARVHALLEERASNRNAIVERRLRELTRDDATAW